MRTRSSPGETFRCVFGSANDRVQHPVLIRLKMKLDDLPITAAILTLPTRASQQLLTIEQDQLPTPQLARQKYPRDSRLQTVQLCQPWPPYRRNS